MGAWSSSPLLKIMTNKKFLVGLSSLVLILGITACNPKPSGGGSSEGDGDSKIIPATINRQILSFDEDDDARITCSLAGVSYQSSDENIVEVDQNGHIIINAYGNAYVTVSKEGYFDKVFKIFVDKDNSIDYLVEGFEFGPAIIGAKISLAEPISASALESANFTARTNNVNRTIIGKSLCDIEGEIINATESKYIRLDFQTTYSGWSVGNGQGCFTYSGSVNNWTANITAEATLTSAMGDYASGTRFSILRGRTTLSTKDWGAPHKFSSNNQTLTYKAYEVDALREDGVKNPLIIWLHGMGEGGTDPDIALLGNDVTALGERTIQSHFEHGAYVLAVQTPTMWMNNGTGGQNGGGNSIYRQTLKDTIDYFIAHNLDIDTNRIYIGGCSNGGYMTMEMAINYGDFFRAYYPCCEAYADRLITNEQIQILKDLPMWFIHAANDGTVAPDNYVIPTYQRIMAAGAQDCHFSYFTDVRGTDCNPNGNNYMGHYSWIYIFRDMVEFDQANPEDISIPSNAHVQDANGNNMNLFDWMENMK